MARRQYRERDLYGYEGIAYAVLELAVNESRYKAGNGPAARYFLASTGCRELIDNLILAWGLQHRMDATELLDCLRRAE